MGSNPDVDHTYIILMPEGRLSGYDIEGLSIADQRVLQLHG